MTPVDISPGFGDSDDPFSITYLMSLQRAIAFPLCSAFDLLLGLNGNFQAPSMTVGKAKFVVFLV